MPVIKKPNTKKQDEIKNTKEEGNIYISSDGEIYDEPEITVETIKKFLDNIYGRGVVTKLQNMVFSTKYDLVVYNDKNEEDDELTQRMKSMCAAKDVKLWYKMIAGYGDIIPYGAAFYNPVWEWEGNEYVLKKLRLLPAYSFDTPPLNATKTYTNLLKGVYLNDENVIEFWQRQTDYDYYEPVQLYNVMMVKNPGAAGISGQSQMVPLVSILQMLKFVWSAQIQQSNRIGAKILFIKVTNPQPASSKNGNVSDIAYANKILKEWGKNKAFQLRENMELIDPKLTDDSNNLEVISTLTNMIIDYIAPTSFLTSGDKGNRLGGSDTARQELIYRYIEGVQQWITDGFEEIINVYFEANKLEGYRAEIIIPTPEVDKTQLKIKQAELAIKGKIASMNELREKLGFEVADDAKVQEILDFWEGHNINVTEMSHSNASNEPTTYPKNVDMEEVGKTTENIEEAANTLFNSILVAIE